MRQRSRSRPGHAAQRCRGWSSRCGCGGRRARSTRRWPPFFDLILEGPDLGNYPEPGSDVRTVAVDWLTSLRDGISEPAIRTAVLAITAQADHDPDSAQALVRIGQDRRAALNTLLEPSGVQIDDTEHTLLYGPVLARLFLDRGQVTDEFIDTVVTQWLTTLERLRGRKLSER
nr:MULTISPECIES: TetR-like C-terminal domain-containing protein [unclassified Streptomyces]